jgi:SAM-dependent methyltransferase
LIRSVHPNATHILELGCGTGKHAEIFCRNGFSVTGVERSADMVALASAKDIPGFQPVVADITSYQLEQKFDVAISLFHVVSYLTTNRMLLDCFTRTSAHLQKGGVFFFDVWYTPAVSQQQPETRIKRLHTQTAEITRLAEPVILPNKNVVEVNYEIIVRHTDGYAEILNEVHPMRHFSWPEIELLALQTGFSLFHAEEFGSGNEPGQDTWGVCFLLKKI